MASGDTLLSFVPQSGEAPATNFAALDARNIHPVRDFAIGAQIMFSGVMPRHYDGGGITIYIHYAMSTATTNDIAMESSIERIGDQQQDLDSDGFAAAQTSGDVTVPGTSGLVDILSSNTHTSGAQMDSLAVGEGFRVLLERIAVAGTDASGDLELRFVEIKET